MHKIVITTHYFAYGPGQALRDYFTKRDDANCYYLEHPLFGNILKWGFNIIQNIIYVIRLHEKINLYVGCNNLNALSGIILKKIGAVEKVIYYSIDFSPNRFTNKFLNKIYLWLDAYCVRNADYAWNCCFSMGNLDPMILQRESLGLSPVYREKQMQVPDGTDLIEIPQEFDSNMIGFVGHLKDGNGLEILFDAFALAKLEMPDLKLLIIGSGPLEEILRSRADLIGGITMTGYMGDINDVYKALSICGAGIAPYQMNNLTPYSDPGKVKVYLSVSLAIIITRVPDIWTLVMENKCGVVAEPDNVTELKNAISFVMKDKDRLISMRENSFFLRDTLTWKKNYDQALVKVGIQ